MKTQELQAGDIVQLNPHKVAHRSYGGCFMVITEVTSWGATGYIQDVGNHSRRGDLHSYTAFSYEMVYVGHTKWIMEQD